MFNTSPAHFTDFATLFRAANPALLFEVGGDERVNSIWFRFHNIGDTDANFKLMAGTPTDLKANVNSTLSISGDDNNNVVTYKNVFGEFNADLDVEIDVLEVKAGALITTEVFLIKDKYLAIVPVDDEGSVVFARLRVEGWGTHQVNTVWKDSERALDNTNAGGDPTPPPSSP